MRTWRPTLILAMGLLAAGGCKEPAVPAPSGTLAVLATIEPVRAIVAEVAGPRVEVTALLPPGASPHTYDPRPSDLERATRAGALVSVAGSLDGWATRLPAQRRLVLLDALPVSFRIPAGEDDHHHGGIDPHMWLDPLAVRAMVPVVAELLCATEPAGCDGYRSRAAEFATRLEALHAELDRRLAPARSVPVVVSEPFLRYLAHRYRLPVTGVVTPQPGTDPGPRTLQTLVEDGRRAGVRAVIYQTQLPKRGAAAVAEALDVPLVALDPIGGVPGRETYEDLLRWNVARLLEIAS